MQILLCPAVLTYSYPQIVRIVATVSSMEARLEFATKESVSAILHIVPTAVVKLLIYLTNLMVSKICAVLLFDMV